MRKVTHPSLSKQREKLNLRGLSKFLVEGGRINAPKLKAKDHQCFDCFYYLPNITEQAENIEKRAETTNLQWGSLEE